MSPDSDGHDRQVWEDLEILIQRSRQNPTNIATGHTAATVMCVLAVNQNAGKVANEILGIAMGVRTQHDVATALTDLITSGFIALAMVVPDAEEYWEINLRELIVKTEE